MSRNSSGTYTLPGGNPVVTGTVISSSWANTTLSDIANALTDSLSRSGQGGMTAPLALDDGTLALPGLTWGTEQNSGLYRAGAGDFRYSIGATDYLSLTTALFSVVPQLIMERDATNVAPNILLKNIRPNIQLYEDDAAADNGRWQLLASTETLQFQAILDDASTGTSWLQIDRTGTTIDTINFGNGTLQYGGIEVGYATLPGIDTNGNFTLLSTNRSRYVRYTGSGGHVISINNGALSTGTLITIFNDGGGSITLTGTISALLWLNGSGSVVAGGRTIAVGGIITLFQFNPTAAYVWGNGLT